MSKIGVSGLRSRYEANRSAYCANAGADLADQWINAGVSCDSCARLGDAPSYASSMPCTLVPPTPNELNPAYRVPSSLQGVSLPATINGLWTKSILGLGAS